jgi:hypothetical protein
MLNACNQGAKQQTSGFAVHLGPPPAESDEQESPVTEKFWWLAFERVADKLENPSQHEQSQRVEPKAMNEKASEKDCEGDDYCRDAEGVAQAIDGVLVAARVLRDPLLAGAIAYHERR